MNRLFSALILFAGAASAQPTQRVWTIYRPALAVPGPAILVLGGSEGGDSGRDVAAALAKEGYAAASLAYFGSEGLPNELKEIPLSYVQDAITALLDSPFVSKGGIGILATSKGAELALLLASIDKRVKALVAYAPSSVVWSCICDAASASSWSNAGSSVPFIRQARDPSYRPPQGQPMRPGVNYRYRVMTATNYPQAVIRIENYRGPLMLIAGDDDQLWPSAEMTNQIRARRSASGISVRDQYLIYRGAGHLIGKADLPVAESTRIAGGRLETGGSREANERAQKDSWPRVIAFFKRELGTH